VKVCGNFRHQIHSSELPNIEFRDQVEPKEAERVIAEAAALLCSSDQEGLPNTFLQAWSYGTPVVTLQIDPDSIIKTAGVGSCHWFGRRAGRAVAAITEIT